MLPNVEAPTTPFGLNTSPLPSSSLGSSHTRMTFIKTNTKIKATQPLTSYNTPPSALSQRTSLKGCPSMPMFCKFHYMARLPLEYDKNV